MGEQGTGRMGPHRPPAQWGWATRVPQNFLRVLHGMAKGLQWGPSALGQHSDPHPLCETSLGWAGTGRGNAEFIEEPALAPVG